MYLILASAMEGQCMSHHGIDRYPVTYTIYYIFLKYLWLGKYNIIIFKIYFVCHNELDSIKGLWVSWCRFWNKNSLCNMFSITVGLTEKG